MRVKISNRYYDLRFVKNLASKGLCDAPHIKGRKILIKSDLTGEDRLDTLLHEILHAADWYKDEEWICRCATDSARILTKLGYHSDDSCKN